VRMPARASGLKCRKISLDSPEVASFNVRADMRLKSTAEKALVCKVLSALLRHLESTL
jgi:hypothetical protein